MVRKLAATMTIGPPLGIRCKLLPWDVITFIAFEHMMVDATQHLGWSGLGRDVITFVALEHMVDATQHVGWSDVLTFVALEHMVDATQHVGWDVLTSVALQYMLNATLYDYLYSWLWPAMAVLTCSS